MNASTVQGASNDGVHTFRQLLAEAIPVALPTWLESRRWFSDKGRPISGIDVKSLYFGRANGHQLALTVWQVAFADGGRAYYFVPLAATNRQTATESILRNGTVLLDATDVDAFGPWLLELMATSTTSADGRWAFASHPDAVPLLDAARQQPATVLRGEQSNTSIRFGDAVIVKLVRRLQPPPNPEEEILRGLTGSGYGGVPAFVGAGSWVDDDGTAYPLMLAQAVVPNIGDGWTWTLRRLSDLVATESDAIDTFAAEWRLGQRTAELHIALSQVPGADFAPALPGDTGIEADRRRAHDAALLAIELLRDRAGTLSEAVRADLPRIIEGLLETAERSAGFDAETDVPRIRVHGDYHLGQALRTSDGDWAIIDFEGEPARSVSERRRKTSALKDVAGMLRSFAYARGAAERSLATPPELAVRRRLREWEQGARDAFLHGYRSTIESAPVSLVPRHEAAFQRALAAWEIDKALYEIAYEARNRPDWIEIPLMTLVPEQGSQQA